MISRSPKRRRHGVVRTKGPIVRVSNSTSLRVMFMAAPHRADWCQNSLTRHPCGKVRNTSQSIDVVQYGKQANGTQRSHCNNPDCQRTIFLLQYHDKGRLPAVKQPIVEMTLNGSGVRDNVRVLGVSSATVSDVLKENEPGL